MFVLWDAVWCDNGLLYRYIQPGHDSVDRLTHIHDVEYNHSLTCSTRIKLSTCCHTQTLVCTSAILQCLSHCQSIYSESSFTSSANDCNKLSLLLHDSLWHRYNCLWSSHGFFTSFTHTGETFSLFHTDLHVVLVPLIWYWLLLLAVQLLVLSNSVQLPINAKCHLLVPWLFNSTSEH